MTKASLPHGHTARRVLRLSLALLLAALSAPVLAANPPPAVSNIPATPAPSDPLAAMDPVELATPDAAPIAEQLQALQAAGAAPSTSTRVKTVLQRAFALLGTPYRWGGSSPDGGFDCSGLVGYVFRSIGLDLPLDSRSTPLDSRVGSGIGRSVGFCLDCAGDGSVDGSVDGMVDQEKSAIVSLRSASPMRRRPASSGRTIEAPPEVEPKPA